ncbi:hypothetical protein D1007_48302 [Hordeum vulgare]|nr:hypothetical protein D1007_48302 [Hordeum vulgare]
MILTIISTMIIKKKKKKSVSKPQKTSENFPSHPTKFSLSPHQNFPPLPLPLPRGTHHSLSHSPLHSTPHYPRGIHSTPHSVAPPLLRAVAPPLSPLPDDVDGYIYIDDVDGYIYIDDDGYIYIDVDDYDYIDVDSGTTSRSSMSRMTRSNPRPTSDEHPLTEYEKVRARNMMRNNRIFQSLGIDAIASMIRKTNDIQEGTTNGVQKGSGVISDDREYNPKEDEVVVHKTVKTLKESRTKRPGVKKTASKKRKSSEASVAMPPRRVMAPPPGQTKKILEPDEPDRVTRQKATMAAATDHQESPLGMDFESLVEMRYEFL